ncbi:amino acid adenylation domain-containing protein, partial [Pseudomonas sp. Pseusp97]|uniref:amino acid adenylation domain-containing protein n=1 Tax=Pseudomonas sp. Pseusp97 TaxID=3243065 RepID=UPI0039A48464
AQPVHLAIARQAAQRGAEVALLCGDEEVDYAALERDSNRLAHRLMALGVGPEVRVGVALPRSVRIPLALLAVLKAGGAYVPLDAEYPRERLEFQMADAGIALLITDSRLRERLPLPTGVTCLELDGLDLSTEDSDLPVVALEPENLAYLIYTSGSTGKPKGVAVSHGPLAMHCAAIGELYRMDAATRELHFMSFAFDGAHERWLTTLVHGGSLVLRGDELWTPEQTYRVLHDKQVSVAAFPPVYLQQLAEHALRDGNPPPVRIYCFGGDAVPNASFELAKRALRAEHLINGYGPTETVVTPLLWKADRATACDAAYAPIGKGVGARKLYILDEQLRQVPLGVAGELYIGGDGLARGYHERAGLTAERFVADPFDAVGGRLYRSGDLVRGRADGVIDYVGRIDHQVKIRGFRIELGEIEARLQDHPQVSEALVVARDGISGKQLVGYVVGEAEGDTLRNFLREQVPDYMVPAQILRLERFPLSPNGKIDRKALPEPTWQGEAYEAPRNERERALAAIWQDVLQVERVGIRDNFFDLGGDSILSLQIVSRARQALGEGVEIRLRDLLQYQTIAGLLERAESVAEATPIVAVEVTDDGESFGLLPIQQWMFDQQLEEPNHFNQAVLLECRQRLDAEALEAALQGLLAEHGSLRLSFARGADGLWRQRYREAAEITGALLWRRQAANTEEALLIANQAQRSLDLSEGRLLRGVLTDMADGSQRLLLVIHHLAVDGVSWRILLEELQQRYAAQVSGEAAPRFERTSAYRAWAEGLHDYADSQLAQADLPYWLEQTDTAGLGEPQRDNPRGAERMAHLEQLFLRLDRQQTQRLLKVAPEAYRTQINDLLLTALGRTLCHWCESESVLIGLEGHGREDILDEVDHSRTLGWFTSLFPLRLTPGQGDYAQAIPAIRQQLRAVPDKGVGYGALRYLGDSALRRQLAARAEPRVTFNYLGQFDQSFDDKALFVPLQEKPGDTYAASTPLNNWLEIVGQVYDGELTLRCMFSRRVFRPSRIEALLAQLRTELEGVIDHCCARVESGARQEQATV